MGAAFPHAYPCRINSSSRVIHCDSCEKMPGVLAELDETKKLLQNAKDLIVRLEGRKHR